MDYGQIIPELHYFMCRYCTPNWVMNETLIDYVDLTYIFDGKVTYRIDGVSYEAGKGDLICIPSNSVRSAEIDRLNPMACYAANFWLTDRAGHPMELPFPILSKIGVREDLMFMYSELNAEWLLKKPGYAIKVRSLLLDVLYQYFNILYYKEPYKDADPRIRRVISYIYENYTSRITVDDLASLVGLNTSYLGTVFRNSTGYHIRDFINRIRVNNAENLIISGNITLKEAAAKSGFDDFFYFSKVFKKIKGYPPSKVVISTFRTL